MGCRVGGASNNCGAKVRERLFGALTLGRRGHRPIRASWSGRSVPPCHWFGGVGSGADVLEAEGLADVAEGEAFVARAVVGHDAGGGDGRKTQPLCDLLAAQALEAQGDDLLDHIRRSGTGHGVRTRAAISHARLAFGAEACQPLGDGPLGDPHHTPHDLGSTVRRGSGIIVDGHPVVPPARSVTTSVWSGHAGRTTS